MIKSVQNSKLCAHINKILGNIKQTISHNYLLHSFTLSGSLYSDRHLLIWSPICNKHCRVWFTCSCSVRDWSGLSKAFKAFFTGRIFSLHCKNTAAFITFKNHVHSKCSKTFLLYTGSVLLQTKYSLLLQLAGSTHTLYPNRKSCNSSNNSRTPLIHTLAFRIGLALRAKLFITLQNYLALKLLVIWSSKVQCYWLLELQIRCSQKVQTQAHTVKSNSWTIKCSCCLFSKKNPVI